MVVPGGIALPGAATAPAGLLRRALTADAVLCAAGGLVMLAGSGWISEVTGLTPGWLPAMIGAVVLLWAANVAWSARAATLSPARVWLVIGVNVLWVVASYGVLLAGTPELTNAGRWIVGILAEIVALCAVVQYVGLRRLRS